jgi:crotonobetaine/carnitine-CoA ligase
MTRVLDDRRATPTTGHDVVGSRTWMGIVRTHAERAGARTALRDAAGAWTYAELVRAADGLAAALLERGAAPGDAVAVYMDTSAYVAVAVLAAHTAGLVVVPVSTRLTEEEVRRQLDHCEARLVIADDALAPAVQDWAAEHGAPLVVHGADGRSRLEELIGGPPAELPPVGPDQLATIMYTSGTTAHPKGVMLSHGNYVYNAEVLKRLYAYGPSDVGLSLFPLYHMNGHNYQLTTWLTAGAEVVLAPRFSASGFARQLMESRATITSLNSTHVKMILSRPPGPEDRAHRLRMVKFGMSLDTDRIAAFEARFGVELCGSYSQTEAIAPIVFNPPEGLRKAESLGIPVLGTVIRLLDEHGEDVAPGEAGEIVVGCASRHGVCLGYHRDEEATAAARRDGWWHTQDLGRFDEDGYLWFAGRLKDMIKHSGFNVAAAEVERVLNAHPDVADSAVIGVPDDVYDEAIKAIVVLRDGAALDGEGVKAHCRDALAAYKVPQLVELVGDLPRTAAGKVDKRVVRERHGGR